MTLAKPTKEIIDDWLRSQQLGSIKALRPLAGGSICESHHLTTSQGERFFLKTHQHAADQLFYCEAAGLRALAACKALRVPAVMSTGKDYLLLEYIDAGEPDFDYWQQLAVGLATVHRQRAPRFGFETDNFCGLTPQPNPRLQDGHAFFGEYRLRYQGRLARDRHLLDPHDIKRLERLIAELPQRIPLQPASLIHGDLWRGNIYCDERGQPVLIDPAAHYGWREADIAMTQLFGALPDAFYRTYQDTLAMEPGWQQRMPIYNLYHLLNHLNLFGGSYLQAVRSTLRDLKL